MQILARNFGLQLPFGAVQLAVTARMNRVIAGDIEHPTRLNQILYVTAHYCARYLKGTLTWFFGKSKAFGLAQCGQKRKGFQ